MNAPVFSFDRGWSVLGWLLVETPPFSHHRGAPFDPPAAIEDGAEVTDSKREVEDNGDIRRDDAIPEDDAEHVGEPEQKHKRPDDAGDERNDRFVPPSQRAREREVRCDQQRGDRVRLREAGRVADRLRFSREHEDELLCKEEQQATEATDGEHTQ